MSADRQSKRQRVGIELDKSLPTDPHLLPSKTEANRTVAAINGHVRLRCNADLDRREFLQPAHGSNGFASGVPFVLVDTGAMTRRSYLSGARLILAAQKREPELIEIRNACGTNLGRSFMRSFTSRTRRSAVPFCRHQ
jgi:hypothetical protein